MCLLGFLPSRDSLILPKDGGCRQPIQSRLHHRSFGDVSIPHSSFPLARSSLPWSFENGDFTHSLQGMNFVVCLSLQLRFPRDGAL